MKKQPMVRRTRKQSFSLCQAITAKGTRCQVASLTSDGKCIFHDPSLKENRRFNGKMGGSQAKVLKFDLKNFQVRTSLDIKRLLADLLTQLGRGKMDLTRADLKLIPQLTKAYIEAEQETKTFEDIKEIKTMVQSLKKGQ